MMSFRKLLLNRCQHEFETDKKEEGDFARMQIAIDNATSVSNDDNHKNSYNDGCNNSNNRAVSLMQDIGRRITVITGELRETEFLFQHLFIALHQGMWSPFRTL